MPLQPSIAPQIQSPIVAIPVGQKSAFEIDIDGLDEKPWRKPGADITDYFNYGFNEETWKMYSQKQVTLRLEQSMQGKIKVYQSDQPSTADLPPELLALTGDSDRGRRKEKPATRGKDTMKPEPPRGRRQRDQDDSVIQVLASGDDQRSPERRSPRRDDSPRRPPSSRERERGERERPRSPPRHRDERPPIPERPKEDPRDRERRERRERERPPSKREEDERQTKRSRH